MSKKKKSEKETAEKKKAERVPVENAARDEIVSVVYETGQRIKRNQLAAFAAQSAFFLLLSFFPFAMMILIAIRFLPFTKEEVLKTVISVFPESLNGNFDYLINEIYEQPIKLAMAISIIIAVWSASKGTMAIERGLNFMDGTVDTKNYFLRRIVNALYTLIFCFMLVALAVVYVLGNTIFEHMSKRITLPLVDNIFFYSKLLTGPVIVFAVILLVYCRLPDKKWKVKNAILGTLFTTICWIALSAAFSLYIEYFGFNTYMYGNLAGMVVAMLWLYACMSTLFLGAEINRLSRDGTIKRLFSAIFRRRKNGKKE